MTVRFYLGDKTAKRSSIVLTIRQGKAGKDLQTLRIGTGFSINPKDWDSKQERIKRNVADSSRINRRLEKIAHKVEELADTATRLLKTDPLPYIKAEMRKSGVLERPVPKDTAPAFSNLLQSFDAFIRERELRNAESTIKRYRVVYHHLQTFLGGKSARFGFKDVTREFYNDWTTYFFVTAGLTNNTVGRHVEMFKSFLSWAMEQGAPVDPKVKSLFRRSDFEKDATTIALTDAELRAIEELDLTAEPRLHNARDLFVIGCLSGMRYSDIRQIKAEHIQDGYIRLHATKTRQALTIPITPRLQRILDRYHPDYAFRPISSQKMNEYLKEIGKLAELTDNVEIVRYSGTRKVSSVHPKYAVLSTHAARRTFITLSLQKKVQPEIIMKISGHKDRRSFEKYIKHADEYLKDEMNRAWE